MDSLFNRNTFAFNVDTLFKFNDISSNIQSHLFRVYSSLMATCMLATLGTMAYINNSILVFNGLFGSIISFSCILYIVFTSSSAQNQHSATYNSQQAKRFAALMLFGYTTGNSIGPLIDLVLFMNPEILTSAVALTAIIFLSFSLTALFAKRRSYLYLGGILGSTLNYLFWGSLINRFFGFQIMYDLQTYLGLMVFSGYVIFDTQVIVEKAERGNGDFVGHALDLFLDFINILIRIIKILADKENKKNKKSNRK